MEVRPHQKMKIFGNLYSLSDSNPALTLKKEFNEFGKKYSFRMVFNRTICGLEFLFLRQNKEIYHQFHLAGQKLIRFKGSGSQQCQHFGKPSFISVSELTPPPSPGRNSR